MSNPLFFDPLLNTAEEPDDSIFFPTKQEKEKSKAAGKKSLFGEDEDDDDIASALIAKKKKVTSAQASPIVSPSGSPKPKVKTIESKPLPSPTIDELDKRGQGQSQASRIDDPFETSLEVAGLNQPKKLITTAKPLIDEKDRSKAAEGLFSSKGSSESTQEDLQYQEQPARRTAALFTSDNLEHDDTKVDDLDLIQNMVTYDQDREGLFAKVTLPDADQLASSSSGPLVDREEVNVERIVQQTKEIAQEKKKQKEQQQQQQLVSLFASDSLSDEATKSYFSQNDTLSEATAAIDINAYILQNQSSSAASSRGLFD